MAYTLAELEEKLGPAEDFILSHASRPLLAQWALAIGTHPSQVFVMDGAALTNLYHERGPKIKNDATELQRLAADMFLQIHDAIQTNKVDPDFLRAIIRETLEDITPRKLEIIAPTHTITLDAPLHYRTETIIKIAANRQNIMMVGPAGCGKTTIGQHTAKALHLPFYITSTINDTHQLEGFIDGHGIYHSRPFRDAFSKGGLWVADEIDAWDASALLAVNAALANGFCVFPDSPEPIYRHPDFVALATANTFGHGADRVYVGRNELDAASLDRFGVVSVDYDLQLERIFANGNTRWLEYVWDIRKQVDKLNIRHVVSSRAIINGAIGLRTGLNWNEVKEIWLFKGMSAKDRAKLELKPDDDIPF